MGKKKTLSRKKAAQLVNATKHRAKLGAIKAGVAPAHVPHPQTGKKQHKGAMTPRERLAAAEFRFLNEQLYTTTAKEASELFTAYPDKFDTYHQGFEIQVQKWPVNPLDLIIADIKSRAESNQKLIVADMGCGVARLSLELSDLTVHSFDLVSPNERVVACDIAKVPLESSSVDVVVFCLSLMGTDFVRFLKEARRILKPTGLLKIAEVESRFASVNKFTKLVSQMGFKLRCKNIENQYFFLFDFGKVEDVPVTPAFRLLHHGPNVLKPCLYKRR